jgi:hypothetical protein
MDEDRTIWWWVLGVLVLAVGAGGWWWWQSRTARPPAVPAVAQTPAEPASSPQAADAPKIEHPIEQAPAAAATDKGAETLPSLADSDSALRTAIVGLFGEQALLEFFQMKGIAGRFVATVDNLSRSKVATKIQPVRGPGGQFVVDRGAEPWTIGAANSTRYAAHMKLLDSLNTRRLAALYLRFYPLLQQAYRELGYPQGYFNDRLVAVIDHLLAAPEPDGPVQLVQPKVLYEFADPALEARSAGQKLLLRLGRANAARVKEKLRQFRREVTTAPMPQ